MSKERRNNLPENPNPNARIGFVIFYPFQFYALKNLYAVMQNDAEFIIDNSVKEMIPDLAFERTAEFLAQKNVKFRVLSKEEHSSAESLENFFSPYKALVGLTLTCCLAHPINHDRVKVRVEYGLGKDLHEFHPNQSKFDLLLLFGNRSLELAKFYTNCEVVGNTRFDDWFNDSIDHDLETMVREKLDPSKKTILYLPTHSDLSSLNSLADELSRINSKFNIVIKPHHMTVYHEPETIDSLRGAGFIMFDDTIDTLALYKVADAVLADNSGVLFETLLIKKPLVVADLLDEEFFEEHRKFLNPKNNSGMPMTYQNSIEQQFKDKATFRVKNPDELESVLKQAIAGDKVSSKSEFDMNNIFSFNDGKCSLRAQTAIQNFLSLKENPPKPILHHVFDAFAEEIKIRTLQSIKKMTFVNKVNYIWKHLL